MFINEISPIIANFSKCKSDCLFVGDFNIDLLKINSRLKYQEYFDAFVSNGFIPKITLPTRLSRRNGSLIDQIYLRSLKSHINATSGIILSNISDHLPQFTSIECTYTLTNKSKYVQIRKFDDNAMENFKNCTSSRNIFSKLNNDLLYDPNPTSNIIEGELKHAHDTSFPVKTVRFNKYKHKNSAWITYGIINSLHNRDKLYKLLKQTNPSSTVYNDIKTNLQTFNKILNNSKRIAKKMHYAEQFERCKMDAKKTWQQINSILSKSKQNKSISSEFLCGDVLIKDGVEIANAFNKYFTEIGPKLAESIPTYPNNNFRHNLLKVHCSSKFNFSTVPSEEVEKIISKLKSKSSSGHDGISSKLLILIKKIIAPSLALVINQSLMTGIFPASLKIAKVIPLFKKGNEKIFGNYRPISLLPSVSKVIEKVVYTQIYDYFMINKLFYKSQYGFRTGHSTELAGLEFSDNILQLLDNKKNSSICIP